VNLEESKAWCPAHPGWSTDILPFLDVMADHIPHGGVYVEIGVFLGRSLHFMGQRRPDLRLVAIDPWEDGESQGYTGPGEHMGAVEAGGGLYNAFLDHMTRLCPDVLARTTILRGTSALYMGPAADLVFIDGAHDEASVRLDIERMLPWVASGGVISGHDYNPDFDPKAVSKDDGRLGVITATHDLLGPPNVGIGPEWSTCWWVQR
jgi:hypothetical protein